MNSTCCLFTESESKGREKTIEDIHPNHLVTPTVSGIATTTGTTEIDIMIEAIADPQTEIEIETIEIEMVIGVIVATERTTEGNNVIVTMIETDTEEIGTMTGVGILHLEETTDTNVYIYAL